MKPIGLLAIAALSLGLSPAVAQPIAPVPIVGPSNTVLTVSGEGKSLRTPDIAMFTAGVTTQGKSAAEALSSNSTAMDRVISQLRAAGIAGRDIQTSNLNVEPLYSDPNRDAAMAARYGARPYVPPAPEASLPKIIGYRATNSVSVRQRDLRNFGKVIDTLVAAGANQVYGPSFTMIDPEPALDQARVQAVQKAKDRAQLYAKAAGLKIVRVLSISEGGGYFGPTPVNILASSSVYGGTPPPPPPPPPAPVQPGELQMNATVTVLFELAP